MRGRGLVTDFGLFFFYSDPALSILLVNGVLPLVLQCGSQLLSHPLTLLRVLPYSGDPRSDLRLISAVLLQDRIPSRSEAVARHL